MVGNGVAVNLAQAAFLRTQATCKVAEMVDGEGNVGIQRFTYSLAVVHGFGVSQQFQVLLNPVGNLEQDIGALCSRRTPPFCRGGVCGIQRQFNVFRSGARRLGVDLAGNGREYIKVPTLDRCNKLAANEIVIAGLVFDFCVGGAWEGVQHEMSPLNEWVDPEAFHEGRGQTSQYVQHNACQF